MICRFPYESEALPSPAEDLVPIAGRIWFWYRAGGDCICQICGRKYYDHPPENDPDYSYAEGTWRVHWLHILCNGDRVKL